MMNAFSRIIAAASAAAMLSAAACTKEPVVKSQNQQTEINFSWWGNDARHKYTLAAIEEFEELHPNIKVNCSYSEWSGYEMRNKVWMISDTEADVMQINYGWLSTYSEDGLGYYDLENIRDDLELYNYTDEALKYGLKNGHLNAVPIAMNAETVYINKTIYDSYGLSIPKTWDDLFNAAKVMSKDGIYPLSAASKSMWLYVITYTEQVCGKSFLKEDGSLNFGEEEFQTMINFYKRLVDEKVMPQVEYYERLSLDNETYAGSVAWISDAVNYFGAAIENGREIVPADYTTIDGKDPGKGWYAKPATMYAVSKNSEHPKEAGMLLDFLLNSQEMSVLQGVEKGIPLSKAAQSSIESEGMLTGIQYEASQKMEGVSLSELDPILENGDLIDDFFTACNDVIFEVKTPEESASAFYNMIVEKYF